MKTLITIALLCLLTSAYSQEEMSDGFIATELIFGKLPRSTSEPCGFGRGICKFKTSEPIASSNASATFNKNQTLTIHIKRNKITLEDEVKIVGHEIDKETNPEELFFLMQEELEIPEDARAALKLPEKLNTLAIGEYPVVLTEKEFIITLKII